MEYLTEVQCAMSFILGGLFGAISVMCVMLTRKAAPLDPDSDMAYCTKCGANWPDGLPYCHKCGERA